MNKLSVEKRVQVIKCLVEGTSIRGTVRITGVAKNTVAKLLVDLGEGCSIYQDAIMHDLKCRRLQFDEIWSFVYSKQKNIPEEHRGEFGYGDVWTWVAMDADTKLVVSFLVGERNSKDAKAFVSDVASRLRYKVQLTTDGYKPYLEAVEDSFGGDIDYAVLHKIYGVEPETQKRYSPAKCLGTDVQVVAGNPDKAHVSTSYVERQNLTMRMGMRRFTRLTNAFSKKAENLAHAVSLHFMYYDFARPHKSLSKQYPTTPAMAAGIADHVWTVEELASLME
ncbi:MAG TPA: IS1 family transposase [Candidatus Aquicultor sp.]|jgi:IS1 family transposase